MCRSLRKVLRSRWLGALVLFICIIYIIRYFKLLQHGGSKIKLVLDCYHKSSEEYSSECNFEGFDNELGTPDGRYIVPNYVHFIRFGQKDFGFLDAVTLLAAYKNQKPEKIFIHYDEKPEGKYWDVVIKCEGLVDVLHLKKLEAPRYIFGQELNPSWRMWHGADISRIMVLTSYGGIFLDNDSYIVRSLNDLRRYEMTVAWMQDWVLMNQVVLANKHARFLRLWYESYREYNQSLWYYNAGEKPTREILEKKPELVHREKYLLANDNIMEHLYLEQWDDWVIHYAFHLNYNHQYKLNRNLSEFATYPVTFNETNIHLYNATIREMIYRVYPFGNTIKNHQ